MAIRLAALALVTLSIGVSFAKEIPSPPYIIKQPPPDEVLFQVGTTENDKPFYIECEATGEPAPKYRWIKNGKEFKWQTYDDRISQQPGRGTLSIAKPDDVDLGQYQCFAENEYGVATSNSVFMRKAELNSFKNQQPIVLEGHEGEPFRLTCQPPDGWPKPTVYWMILYTSSGLKTINNSRMTLDPEGNLWFSNLTAADSSSDFYYACAATSPTKLEFKVGDRVLLNVRPSGISASQNKHPPVQQYVTRKNEVAYRGKRAELFCIFGGTPLPHTVWSKDGRVIEPSDRVTQGNYGKSLVIKSVDFSDNGTYTCDVSNGVDEPKSYSINLKVLAVPYFTVEPKIVNAAEDETAVFHCEASGVPEPEIKWIHNGRPIEEAPPNPRRKVMKNRIIIERLNKKDTGNYGCNATNSLGYVYKDVYVNVLALAPEITEAPREMEAVIGQDINMTCRVFGAPKPAVKWIQNDRELTGGRFYVQENGDLLITSVQFDDTGNYTCFAENKFGSTNASAAFQVKSATQILNGPEDYEVPAGSQATFRCIANSDSSLDLEIYWLLNDKVIDFDEEPRFVKTTDHSLTITKTIELDSGTYTCLAKTRLDEARAKAQLTVQDVPNSPKLKGVKCHSSDATISWEPMGDNRAQILGYIIQYNTSFTPDTWEIAYSNVPPSDMTYNVPMSPWANYTFRIIAWNKIGESTPSAHSDVCTTQPDVPHKNPDNVIGEGDQPDNLVIKWTPMAQIEHNGPKFQYRVYYRRDIPGAEYETEDILDWRRDSFVVNGLESFQQYRIKVVAINALGEANVAPKEVIGYSGENVPLEAPRNFTVDQIQTATTALLRWEPVPLESVRGHFKGYKIKTWTDNGNFGVREIKVHGEASKALVNNLVPFSMNYARVYVYNGKYIGPPSETLKFETPEGVPDPVQSLEAYPIGLSSFLLEWKEPEQPNGILTGYKVYYAEVENTSVGNMTLYKEILDPHQKRLKISRLKPGVKYRIYIRATTAAGDGKLYFIEQTTRSERKTQLQKPHFTWQRLDTTTIRVTWHPNLNDEPASHFFVNYRKKGETTFKDRVEEENEVFVNVPGLTSGEKYEFMITTVDGDQFRNSDIQEVDTDGPLIHPTENVATAAWFIGMMLAIAFLLLVLIMVCVLKRNRGGKYAVHEREQANGRHDYPDEGGFHEYSQPLDNKSHGRASMSSDQKVGPESDTDSMAEYGEGDTGRFTEDGSFIGQYVPSNMKQLSSAPANNMVYNNATATYV